MMLLHDAGDLPDVPDKREAALLASLGPSDIEAIDQAIIECCRPHSLKIARIALDVMSRRDLPSEDAAACIVIRRVIALADAGKLQILGNPRRPRFSEVLIK
jgi:hypothetical protein